MFRKLIFKPIKPTALGRWSIDAETALRRAELAHCDNCGTCDTISTKNQGPGPAPAPSPPPPPIQPIPKTPRIPMVLLGDDVIDLGYAPGSFDLYTVR